MQSSVLLGAVFAIATLGWFVFPHAAAVEPPPSPPTPPTTAVADGHYVLVVEGDRQALTITHASRKVEPWAGVAKGFTSDWTLSIRDARGELLAEVPLDVSQFAVGADELGKPVRVEGCVVHDSHIGMLVSAPRFATAASYAFSRRERQQAVGLGECDAATVRTLAGDDR